MSTNQAPTNDEIREFVIAGHGNLTKVKQLLTERPIFLNLAYEWRPGDNETALQGAAHVGNPEIADYLLGQGAPLDICTAAMLGRQPEIEQFLQADANQINANGAHGITLLTHAALSGIVALVQMLYQRGANTGATPALSLAVNKGHREVARWLLENGSPDLTWKNYEGKTALEIATTNDNTEIVDLLKAHGAEA